MKGKITWNDLQNGSFKELQKTYKLSDKQLEMGVRKHLDGASVDDRRKMYKQVWTPAEKR